MAIHRRLRKAAHLPLQAHRRGREALQRRRAGRGHARGEAQPGVDERLAALAGYVLAGQHYECAWELFRFGQFKGLSHEDAAIALGAWAREHGIAVAFDLRNVRDIDVIFVLLRPGSMPQRVP